MTPIQKLFYKTPEAGAQTQVMLAVEPELASVTGKYFVACAEKEPSPKALDETVGEWLWEHSKELTRLEASEVTKA